MSAIVAHILNMHRTSMEEEPRINCHVYDIGILPSKWRPERTRHQISFFDSFRFAALPWLEISNHAVANQPVRLHFLSTFSLTCPGQNAGDTL